MVCRLRAMDFRTCHLVDFPLNWISTISLETWLGIRRRCNGGCVKERNLRPPFRCPVLFTLSQFYFGHTFGININRQCSYYSLRSFRSDLQGALWPWCMCNAGVGLPSGSNGPMRDLYSQQFVSFGDGGAPLQGLILAAQCVPGIVAHVLVAPRKFNLNKFCSIF